MSTRRDFITKTTMSGLAAAYMSTSKASPRSRRSRSLSHSERHEGKLNFGIVGVGDVSPRYLKPAAESGRARFVATCAHHLESAKARAIEYGINSWFDDYNVMYDKVHLDGVVVATPSALHAAPTIAALKRGIPVLCEKPMATTWADCQAMVQAARSTNTVFLSLPYDAHPPYLAALKYINQATLGVFTGAEAQLLLPGPGRNNWYYEHSVAGGAMLDSLVYPVSSLLGMLGPARRVTGFVNTLIPHRFIGGSTVDFSPPKPSPDTTVVDSNVDDNVTLVVEWKNGQQAILRTLWGTSFIRMDSTVYGREGTLWLAGGDVIIHSPLRPVPGAEPTAWRGIEHCYRVPVTLSQNEGLIEHFADCIEKAAQPTCGGQQQLHVHEILFKGYDAARTGSAQELETTFTPWHSIEPSFSDTHSHPT